MQTILFIELLGGMGDVLIALPAIQALSRSHPNATLTVLTFAPGSELLKGDPLIHHVLGIEKECVDQTHLARNAVAALLERCTFDLIVSDTCYDGIDQLIQTSNASQTVTNLWRSPPPNQRVGDRFLHILLADGFITPDAIAPPQLHLTAAETLSAQQLLRHYTHPLVVLYPDAGMAIKRWSIASFVSLGHALQEHGATVIVPIGAAPEQAMQIVQAIGGTAMVWAQGTLRSLAALMATVDLVIAADTGPARIAAAVHTPTITLFGPSWHDRYGQPAPHINLQGYPDCPERHINNFTTQCCWYSGECPFDGWHCMDAISPAEVIAAAAPFLRSPTSEPEAPSLELKLSSLELKTQNSKLKTPIPSLPTPHLQPQWSAVRNILVMRLDNIGDVLMTSPALRAIKDALPDARLTLMASPSGSQAAVLLPWVDEVFVCRALWQDMGNLAFDPDREWDFIHTLRDRQFDAAIIFTSFSQTPHPAGMMCYLAGIPLRLGGSKEWGGAVLTTEVKAGSDTIHQVERNLTLLEAVGFPVHDRSLQIEIPTAAQQSATAKLREHGLQPNESYILLNPWTSCQSRNYSTDRFAIAACQLAEATGDRVVVTGIASDRAHSAPLLDRLGTHAIDLIGDTSLSEVAALIANARLMLSNNTSTMHLADATRTPSVILFSGTEYECQWQPRHTASRLLRQPTTCSPCYAFICPYSLECLDIPPEAVVAAGLKLLGIADLKHELAEVPYPNSHLAPVATPALE